MSEIKYCKDCAKIFTKYCPIRIWGRNEGRKLIDVDQENDYCSKFIDKESGNFFKEVQNSNLRIPM